MNPAVLDSSVRATRSEATRRAILEAAEQLLADHSEDALSIRELCVRASVTPPTIYHHFGSKAALVDRVVDDCFTGFNAALDRRTPPAAPIERLRWGWQQYVEYGLHHPAHYRLMFLRANGRPTPAGRAAYDRLRRIVQLADDAGQLAVPVNDAAAAIWAAVHGVTSLIITGLWPADAPAAVLVREALIEKLTTAATPSSRRRNQSAVRDRKDRR